MKASGCCERKFRVPCDGVGLRRHSNDGGGALSSKMNIFTYWIYKSASGLTKLRRPAYGAGEKSVSAMKVESTFSTSFPFTSEASRTFCHSGSSLNAFQLLTAASRLG